MRRCSATLLGLLLCAATAAAQNTPPEPKLTQEIWDAAFLDGQRAGHVRTSIYEYKIGEYNLLRTVVGFNLTVKRFNTAIQLRMENGTDELDTGTVVGTFMRQYPAQNKPLLITGQVVGKELQLKQDGTPIKPAPWNPKVLGLHRQQTFLKDRNVKPGDELSYLSFEPTVNLVVTVHVKVKDHEMVEMLDSKTKVKLLRVETTPEKIENVQLPTLVLWLDDQLQIKRSQVDLPGLGQLTLQRTTREAALLPAQAALTDIGISQLIKLGQRIARPYATTTAVYRVSVKNDENPGTAFAQSDRQQVKNVQGDTFELHVQVPPAKAGAAEELKNADEFLQSSYFITSDDAQVKRHARMAVGQEADAWKKALLIEKWVHDRMKNVSHEALATAAHVAQTLEGDCTEHAMLMAAMCRAEGVPARTAIGLIYADVAAGPVFAFHMWTEVWHKGQWVPLDATLGQGFVGATHLKITDHSWHETRSLTPLLPVIRVVGKMSIAVVGTGP